MQRIGCASKLRYAYVLSVYEDSSQLGYCLGRVRCAEVSKDPSAIIVRVKN